MSVLNRKLFNRGGRVSSRGVGITSGLDTPRRGYVDGPGSYNGQNNNMTLPEATERRTLTDFQKESKSLLDRIYEPSEPRSRLRDASPALMQFFGSLAAGKSLQGGFGGGGSNITPPADGTIGATTGGQIGSALDFGGANQAARQAYRAMTPEQLQNFGALTQYGEGITRRQFIDQYNMGGQALDLYSSVMSPIQGYGTY